MPVVPTVISKSYKLSGLNQYGFIILCFRNLIQTRESHTGQKSGCWHVWIFSGTLVKTHSLAFSNFQKLLAFLDSFFQNSNHFIPFFVLVCSLSSLLLISFFSTSQDFSHYIRLPQTIQIIFHLNPYPDHNHKIPSPQLWNLEKLLSTLPSCHGYLLLK